MQENMLQCKENSRRILCSSRRKKKEERWIKKSGEKVRELNTKLKKKNLQIY
jgi:hypothetical protein